MTTPGMPSVRSRASSLSPHTPTTPNAAGHVAIGCPGCAQTVTLDSPTPVQNRFGQAVVNFQGAPDFSPPGSLSRAERLPAGQVPARRRRRARVQPLHPDARLGRRLQRADRRGSRLPRGMARSRPAGEHTPRDRPSTWMSAQSRRYGARVLVFWLVINGTRERSFCRGALRGVGAVMSPVMCPWPAACAGRPPGSRSGSWGLGTPLCQRLGIEHPVFCAGMGGYLSQRSRSLRDSSGMSTPHASLCSATSRRPARLKYRG